MFENDHRIPEITPLPPMFFVVGGQLLEQSKIVKKESTLHEVIRGINVPKRNGEVKKVRTETAANGAANKNGKKQETVVQTEKHKQANKHRLLGEYKPYNHPARWRY